MFPLEWMQYAFMKHALLAVLLATPLFALMGTIVVNNRMAFFSDVLGHSALCGIALGILFGIGEPLWAMIGFMVFLAIVMNYFQQLTETAFDTILGIFFAAVVALGVVILSRGGGFSKFTTYLIGDILTVTPNQIQVLAVLFLIVLIYWVFFGNSLLLVSVNSVLARSRGIPAFWIQTSFTILLAVVVACSIRLVGILIINSLLVLPAAAARNLARDMRSYTWWAITISLFSGVMGLISSYYWGTASGATIVLFAVLFYLFTVFFSLFGNRKLPA